jgi:hypothetical protein
MALSKHLVKPPSDVKYKYIFPNQMLTSKEIFVVLNPNVRSTFIDIHVF